MSFNPASAVELQLLSVDGCPNAGRVRELVQKALSEAGVQARLAEPVGDYPSPTLLVDGIDVVTGRPLGSNPACRLDLPTEAQILSSLEAAVRRRTLARIRHAAFRGLLTTAAPVNAADLAVRADLSMEVVSAGLRELAGAGRVHVTHNDQVIGSAGLSVVPSRHELLLGGRLFWTWCAWDAVGILGALRASGVIRSRDPLTGAAIAISFTAGLPEPSHVAMFRADDEGYASIRDEYCPLTNLFHDGQTAEAWARERGVRGIVAALPEATTAAAQEWSELVAGLAPPGGEA